MIGYLDDVIRPLVLKLPKMIRYIKVFKGKNYKSTSLRIDEDKLLEKYKTIWNKIENLKILNLMLYQFMITDRKN